jgi:tetratricopeptide (TPR) repeat protein
MEINPGIIKARELQKSGNFEQAAEEYRKLIDQSGNSEEQATLYNEISWAYYHTAKYEEAIASVSAALRLNSEIKNKEDLYRVKAFSYIALNEMDLAEKFLLKSLELDRSSEKQQVAVFELAKLYFKRQSYKQALELILEIEPYFYQNQQEYWQTMLFYKGFIYYYQDNYTKSEEIFEELLENAADMKRKASALYGLAYIAFQKKDYLKTINLCETVLSYDRDFFDLETIGFLVSTSFHYLGRDDVFEKYATELIKKYPEGRYTEEIKKLIILHKNAKNN